MIASESLSARGRMGVLLAYGIVTFLSFPHALGEGVLDLGLVASWLGPALLVWGLWGLSPGRAALSAIVAGWLAHSLVLHWFFVVTVTYGHAPPWIGVLAPVGAALYPALLMGLFGLGWAIWIRGGGSSPFPEKILNRTIFILTVLKEFETIFQWRLGTFRNRCSAPMRLPEKVIFPGANRAPRHNCRPAKTY